MPVEDTELVADAVADGGYLDRGERVEVAGGEASESAVAEPGFLLLLEQLLEVEAESVHGLAGLVHDAEVEQIVGQMGPGQKLGREVGDDAGILLGEGFEGPDTLFEDAVADGQGQGGVKIVVGGGPGDTSDAAEEVVEERELDVLDARAGAHAGSRATLAGISCAVLLS